MINKKLLTLFAMVVAASACLSTTVMAGKKEKSQRVKPTGTTHDLSKFGWNDKTRLDTIKPHLKKVESNDTVDLRGVNLAPQIRTSIENLLRDKRHAGQLLTDTGLPKSGSSGSIASGKKKKK